VPDHVFGAKARDWWTPLYNEKDAFHETFYDGIDEPDSKIIDVFICKLRKKLSNASGGKDYIETVWGRGYTLRGPSDGNDTRLTAS
jgi:two-component system, cell cycle response regulator CtrA